MRHSIRSMTAASIAGTITCLTCPYPPLIMKLRKEQADNQKQGILMQVWSQRKPTSKSKTIEENKDEARTKRQRIL